MGGRIVFMAVARHLLFQDAPRPCSVNHYLPDMRNLKRLDIRILVLIAAVLLLFSPQILIPDAGGRSETPLSMPIFGSIFGE